MKDVRTDLFAAVRNGDADEVREILKDNPEAATARDADGATALHYAAESGNREIVEVLLKAGADINARDLRFGATPAGWAIEYLRERGGLLGIEIEDAVRAIVNRDESLVQRYVKRFPALRDAVDRNGKPLKEHAAASGSDAIDRIFNKK